MVSASWEEEDASLNQFLHLFHFILRVTIDKLDVWWCEAAKGNIESVTVE